MHVLVNFCTRYVHFLLMEIIHFGLNPTGNIWQETLYEAVDNAKLVAAFISKSYLKSTICQEEYNIALARFLSEVGGGGGFLSTDAFHLSALKPAFGSDMLVNSVCQTRPKKKRFCALQV